METGGRPLSVLLLIAFFALFTLLVVIGLLALQGRTPETPMRAIDRAPSNSRLQHV